MRRILITNDDGVRSEGIAALADALRSLGEVTIVAPAKEASAVGHALTLHHPLRLERLSPRVYAVDGTPTDCVNLAVSVVLKGLPDLIVSGINMGWNLGDDVTYSGTVAGALEGTLLGVPSLAVSLQRTREPLDFRAAARAATHVAKTVLANGLPARTFLNINVPRTCRGEYRTTVLATRTHLTQVAERIDPKHRTYYWIDEAVDEWNPHTLGDYDAVMAGFVSVTPLHPDMTAHAALAGVECLLHTTKVSRRARVATPAGRKKTVGKNRKLR